MSNADILYAERNALLMTTGGGHYDLLTLSNYDLHCFVPRCAFDHLSKCTTALPAVLYSLSAVPVEDGPWTHVKNIFEKVDNVCCGHGSNTDMRILLD